MLDKETKRKIASCKALRDVTVYDIIGMPRFGENLTAYWTAQKTDREAMKRAVAAIGKMGVANPPKVSAHPIDELLPLTAEELATEYAKVLAGTCQYRRKQTEYIRQIGQQAYNLTVAQIVCEEYPELEPILLHDEAN